MADDFTDLMRNLNPRRGSYAIYFLFSSDPDPFYLPTLELSYVVIVSENVVHEDESDGHERMVSEPIDKE